MKENQKIEESVRKRNDFTKLVEAYKEFRRDYPERVYRDLFIFCPNLKSNVLDLGCGTGIATKHLAGYYSQVVGMDNTQEMLDAGRADLPEKVRLIKGSADSLPFADESFDLVVSAQAFHWFDYDKAGTELMRVLKSDGKFYTFWKNGRADTQFNLPLFVYKNILKYIPEIPRSGKEPINENLFKRIGFHKVEKVEFDCDEEYTEEEILGYVRSHSAFNLLSETDKGKFMSDNKRDLQLKLINGVFTFSLKMLVYKCEK